MSQPLAPTRLAVVGLGDDGPAGLSERARALIAGAELLVGGRRHLAFFAEHPAEQVAITNNVEQAIERLADESVRRRCVVLASGDPCFFGIGPLLAERLGPERVEIIPQPSSVALAFARLGLAWQDATVLSAHGRPLAGLLGPALMAGKLAILTDDVNTPAAVAEALLAAGLVDCPAFVAEHLGGPSERIVCTRLAKLPGQRFARLNVLVLLSEPAEQVQYFGRSESAFVHQRGQVTKAEVRAVALAKLRLPANGLLWDVGAGSGSLAIEAAGLMPSGRVLAIERDSDQLECLRENLRRHRRPTVEPVAGAAPAVLAGLARPDRVFVGGGGVASVEIVTACLERLAGRGRLVLNAATLETVVEADRVLRRAGWSRELVQLSIARGREIGGRTRLAPLGPVFILTGWPPDEAAS
jgi:precorrin-6B C5,15-methyltransferase / cobalt-precorrin-6B C5,C15-methyltransferase